MLFTGFSFRIARDHGRRHIQIKGKALNIISAIVSDDSVVCEVGMDYIKEARSLHAFFQSFLVQ